MEKFNSFLGSNYFYSTSLQDLPEKTKSICNGTLGINWDKEGFVAAAWISNFMSKGEIFILITQERIIYRDIARINQNLFSQITGIEKVYRNIKVLSPGNYTSLFPGASLPSDSLVKTLFPVINQAWLNKQK